MAPSFPITRRCERHSSCWAMGGTPMATNDGPLVTIEALPAGHGDALWVAFTAILRGGF